MDGIVSIILLTLLLIVREVISYRERRELVRLSRVRDLSELDEIFHDPMVKQVEEKEIEPELIDLGEMPDKPFDSDKKR